jgi:hypothetical protein
MISLDDRCFGQFRHQPERFDFDYHSRDPAAKPFPAYAISEIAATRQVGRRPYPQQDLGNWALVAKPQINELPK